jgi:cell division protein FtsW
VIGLIGLLTLASLAYFRPYVKERIMTFFDPSQDALNSSYQVNQSLIAIGSGGVTGRGFGQSVQKFNYLPEPIGDSIFAIAGEEFGMVGTVGIVALFLLFSLWGVKIVSRTTDPFSRLLGGGIVILIVSQAMINIASMIGLIPLTGVPLPFISHGGTTLFITLFETGIIMNISRQKS